MLQVRRTDAVARLSATGRRLSRRRTSSRGCDECVSFGLFGAVARYATTAAVENAAGSSSSEAAAPHTRCDQNQSPTESRLRPSPLRASSYAASGVCRIETSFWLVDRDFFGASPFRTFSSSAASTTGGLFDLLDDEGIDETTTETGDDRTTATKRGKRRRPRQRRPPPTLEPPPPIEVPLQSREAAEKFFDAIAPHCEYRTLRVLRNRVAKLKSKDVDPQKTLIGRVLDLFEKDTVAVKGGGKRTGDVSWQLPYNGWLKPLLTDFLAGRDVTRDINAASHVEAASSSGATDGDENDDLVRGIDDNSSTGVDAIIANREDPAIIRNAVLDDRSFPPNRNRRKFDSNVEILMKAREVRFARPLFWRYDVKKAIVSAKMKKGQNARGAKMKQVAGESTTIEQIHASKSPERLRSEAESMASLLADRLPRGRHNALMKMLEDYSVQYGDDKEQDESRKSAAGDAAEQEKAASSISQKKKQRKARIEPLLPFLKRMLNMHVHLVAADIADFFYVDVPDEDRTKLVGDGSDGKALLHAVIGHPDLRSFKLDPRIKEAVTEWNEFRTDVVKALLTSQHAYASPLESNPPQPDKKDDLDVEMEKIFEKLDRLRTRPSDGEKVGRDRSQRDDEPPETRGRRPQNVHLAFDAFNLNDSSGPTMINAEVGNNERPAPNGAAIGHHPLPQSGRTVFLSNLPIDADEKELYEIYSRCGTIESLSLFNLRPDVDPGPLSAKKRAENKRRNRSTVNQQVSSAPPRTPVYGRVTFATEDGYRTATIPELTIFGCVIRRHPVQSIEAHKMTRIFIENIPPGIYSLDLEYKLSRALNPYTYVSLGEGQNDYSEPKSCEIRFETFDEAHHAFHQLQQVDIGEDIVLNWFRTPDDAMKYWTRELDFDP